jgi:hypothetical protein
VLLGFLEVVRGEHDRVAVAVQAPHELPQPLAQLHVHPGRRLVQDDDRRLVHQGLRHQHAPLHAPRERAHVDLGLLLEIEDMHQLLDPAVVAPQPEIAGLQTQGLAHREEGVEHQFLRHHAEQLPRAAVLGGDVRTEHGDAARVGARQPRDDVDQRRFARAVRAEQAEELALAHLQRHAVERVQRAVALLHADDVDGRDQRAASSGRSSATP